MDETTQQNAALVEEAAAAAESLVDQANQLAVAISQFKLEDRVGHGAHLNSGYRPHQGSSTQGQGYAAHTASSRSTGRPIPAPAGLPDKPAPVRVSARTGTDDSDWETF